MLHSLVEHVKLNASAAISKVVGRIIIAVAFVIAAGFAVAAIAVWLAQSVGAIAAYAILAVAFAVIGIMAGAFFAIQARNQQRALRQSRATRAAVISSLAANPVALASSVKGLQKAFGGRGPMAVLLLVAAGLLLRRSASAHNAAHADPAHNNSHARPH